MTWYDFSEVQINNDHRRNRKVVSTPDDLKKGFTYILRSGMKPEREFGTFKYEGTYNTAFGVRHRFRNTVDTELWHGLEASDFNSGQVVMEKIDAN